MSHTIPFTGDKTFLCIYAHNENQRVSVEKISATTEGTSRKGPRQPLPQTSKLIWKQHSQHSLLFYLNKKIPSVSTVNF